MFATAGSGTYPSTEELYHLKLGTGTESSFALSLPPRFTSVAARGGTSTPTFTGLSYSFPALSLSWRSNFWQAAISSRWPGAESGYTFPNLSTLQDFEGFAPPASGVSWSAQAVTTNAWPGGTAVHGMSAMVVPRPSLARPQLVPGVTEWASAGKTGSY